MHPAEPPIDTPFLDNDQTLNPEWQAEQTDRLLGYEILHHTMTADYHPVAPAVLADKIAADKGLSYRIIESLQAHLHAR